MNDADKAKRDQADKPKPPRPKREGGIADPWSKSFDDDCKRSNTIWGNRM